MGDIKFGADLLPLQHRKIAFKLATACLEGKVAQDRRPPGMNRHLRPIEQLRPNFVRR